MKFCRFEIEGFAHYGQLELRAAAPGAASSGDGFAHPIQPPAPVSESQGLSNEAHLTPWVTALLTHAPLAESALLARERKQQVERAMQHFEPIPLAALKLLTPVDPTKILCVGRNYLDHAQEMGNEAPQEPLIFFKPVSSLLAPGGVVLRPAASDRVDFEGELTVVIGKRTHRLSPDDDWRSVVLGYTLANDVTARDLQEKDDQWARAKGFDTFCPLGPWVSNEIDPHAGVTIETRVNGALRQKGTTRDFIFRIPELLVYITSVMTLEPGDIILTGTPAGIAPLAAGDEVAISVDGLGVLTNSVANE